ncbi:MAG: hypothetical protein KDH96_05865 [Candidatus Riesia sp.]|nr:hypothetical protein [Candidatus Riesia sp.]
MEKNEEKAEKESIYEYEYKSDYESDWDVHRQYIQTFDPLEAMLLGQVYDSVSNSVDGSKITDSYTTTLAKERADRVISKLPEGETEAVGKADVGKAAFMDILRQKWVYPNANAQRPFLEKLNMWQLYSSVYGYMPMFYDWSTSHTGYVGPDCWLWNPRNLIPQQGKISIEDCDYVTALTWVSEKSLKNIIDNSEEGDGWDRDALKELLGKTKTTTSGNDTEKDTFVERDRNQQGAKKGICLATRYEAGVDGKWITFAPDNGFIKVRELDNPHKNGRIPFVIKYSQPLFDSFYGLGDFQRAKPVQFARDGLTNFYFANLKRNLAPGIIANANGVLKHTLDITKPNPVLMETIPNSIRPIPTNTAGFSTYQGAQTTMTASLLSLFGTQNASIPGAEALNPSQGRTPAAINMYTDKEATRDGAEIRHLETAIEQLTDGFFSLIVNIGTEEIPVSLFYEDIKTIVKNGYKDVMGIFTTNPLTGQEEVGSKTFSPDESMSAGNLRIDPTKLKGIDYRFNIKAGTTQKTNKEQQLQSLERFIGDIGKFQNLFKDDPRYELHPDKIAAAFAQFTDIPNADEFITMKEGPSPLEAQLMQQVQQLQQQIQQMQQEQQMGMLDQKLQAIQSAQAATPNGISNSAGLFKDPDIANVAEQVNKL